MRSYTRCRLRSMCKALMIAVLAALLLVGCAAPERPDKAAYTILIYMPGSDLESDFHLASDDLKEMMQVGSSSDVRIVLETGGARKWWLDTIAADRNQRWLVQKNRLELIQDVGRRNMDNKDTLQDFIQWGVEAFPAKNYVLVFWGHGLGAVDGYGGDEAYGNKKMKLPVIQSALHDAYQKTGVKFDLIGFDACKMAGLEIAYALRQYGEYMVAAVDYTNKNGWDYETVFQTLHQRPDISPVDLANAIAVSYHNHSLENEEEEDLQQSVIRLSKVEEVVKEVDLFSKQLVELLPQPETFSKLADARNRAENYADEADMVDLADFTAYMGQAIGNEEGAKKIARAVEQAVVSNIKTPEHPIGKGISIYFPAEDKTRFQEKADIYQQIDFSANYKQLITLYTRELIQHAATEGSVTTNE